MKTIEYIILLHEVLFILRQERKKGKKEERLKAIIFEFPWSNLFVSFGRWASNFMLGFSFSPPSAQDLNLQSEKDKIWYLYVYILTTTRRKKWSSLLDPLSFWLSFKFQTIHRFKPAGLFQGKLSQAPFPTPTFIFLNLKIIFAKNYYYTLWSPVDLQNLSLFLVIYLSLLLGLWPLANSLITCLPIYSLPSPNHQRSDWLPWWCSCS